MSKSNTLKCQECDRPVVNRLVDQCLYCGETLTVELILTEAEKDRLRAKEMKKLHAYRKARLERDEEKANATTDTDIGLWTVMFPFGI